MNYAEAIAQKKRHGSKFTAVPTVVDGVRFGSKGEAARFSQLQLMERGGLISALKPHPRFDLIINGLYIGRFTPDFVYREGGVVVVEDYKGHPGRTPAYALRRKVFQALYPNFLLREQDAKFGAIHPKPPQPLKLKKLDAIKT
jgi:hypothetical protein